MRCDLVPYEGIGYPGLDPAFLDVIPDIQRRTFEFIAEVVLAPLGYVDQPPPPVPAVPPAPPQAPPAVPVAIQPAYTG